MKTLLLGLLLAFSISACTDIEGTDDPAESGTVHAPPLSRGDRILEACGAPPPTFDVAPNDPDALPTDNDDEGIMVADGNETSTYITLVKGTKYVVFDYAGWVGVSNFKDAFDRYSACFNSIQ